MEILRNISLKEYNTFGIAATAKFFAEITTIDDLIQVLGQESYTDRFIISGGSNILITKDIDALVLHINIKGITVAKEDADHVVLKVNAGENWHNLVLWTLDQDYGGLENLSLIPGNCGTAPIQNIGAYGVELKDCFVGCDAIHIKSKELRSFTKEDCKFGYRDSFFKNDGKGKYIITTIYLKLTKRNHVLNTSYGAISSELKRQNIIIPNIKDVSNAVVAIRQEKLPDPKELGNSGSFFKNPVVTKEVFNTLHGAYSDIPSYRISEDVYKIPAGWLIEQCGFKGKRYKDAGVHSKQALVLVNYGSATGADILDLAHNIQKSVLEKFNIRILPEVNIIK